MEDRRRWRFEKSISIGQLITALTVVGSVISYVFVMDKRIALLERDSIYNAEAHRRIDTELKDSMVRVESTLGRIEVNLNNKEDKKK